MRPFLLLALILALANCEQRPLVFTNWPPKSRASAGAGVGAGPPGKPRTLVVQIRSDQPVPLVLKGRPGHGPAHAHSHAAHSHAAHLAHPHSVHPHVLSHAHSHAHLHSHPLIHVPQHQLQYQHQHLRGPPRHTPIKLNGPSPVYLKPAVASLRKPLKIKLNNVKPKAKPTFGYDKPFKYEKPAVSYSELQNLPKLFAPDPDPSLPTTKIRPATESFNTPSNNKPLPADVQSNHLPAQPLVQIVGAQAAAQTAPEIYPIQYAQPAAAAVQSQSFLAAIPAAHIPIYNPTYLVTQSNQLYSAHQQQLFKPSSEPVVESGYVNADLTQEVASNGQILQAAKDPHHNIHPVLDAAPQYAALIAAPALGSHGESGYETASFHLPNVASAVTASIPEGGFVVSNFYGHTHDSSQLLQAYAEEESRRQQLETEHAATELQRQQQLHLDELKAQAQEQQQQHQLHLEELRAQAQYQQQQQQFEELQAQAQEQHLQQQHQQQQLQLLQLQQQHQQLQQPVQHHPQQQLQPVQHQQQQQLQQQQQVAQDPAASAFEEHQRLVQQQLGPNTPLRIFVPDEEASESRLQKRSDDVKKGTVEDVPSKDLIESDSEESAKDLFEVSTSVEVAGQHLTASSN
ncbi:uncharacterized protein LOC128252807 isoform X2 [Drosophila gunungcola]|uniref:uncharacterized protein LOC128252807 isoform X2 n=1 Tax=Drosophila gunungcola TaxID=103775 RepID=UPI0022E5D1F5|nr:uncharacterized protein LOC128252807 isoform X2 [Drosophila gunungcola]